MGEGAPSPSTDRWQELETESKGWRLLLKANARGIGSDDLLGRILDASKLLGETGSAEGPWNGTFGLLRPWTLAEVALGPQDAVSGARVTALGPSSFWKAIVFSLECAVHSPVLALVCGGGRDPGPYHARCSRLSTFLGAWTDLWGEAPLHCDSRWGCGEVHRQWDSVTGGVSQTPSSLEEGSWAGAPCQPA